MLREISCNVFRTKTITFHSGLNVILGDENATNSIGKSTLLMVVDFAMGGSDLLSHNSDLVAELGHHDYLLTFQFGRRILRYQRGTHTPTTVYACNEKHEPIRALNVEEYTELLKHAYEITVHDLTFRGMVGLYLRIWGKGNLDVAHPLHVVQRKKASECVDDFIKVFDRYSSVRELTNELKNREAELSTFRSAVRRGLVSKVGKRQYDSNKNRIVDLEREINDIRENLDSYATSLSILVNREMLELKSSKDALAASRLALSNRLERIRGNLTNNRKIKSSSFRGLLAFFPEINQERLAQVENFHSGVTRLLSRELRAAEVQLERQLSQIDAEIMDIDSRMHRVTRSINEPSHIIDRVIELSATLQDARNENQQFDREISLTSGVKELKNELSHEKKSVLATVESIANDGMQAIMLSVFGVDRKSPRLSLSEKSYSFDVYEDTGTGTAYASLVVLDLMVFLGTQLPVIAHDSLLFKNIENDAVAGLLHVYLRTNKQSFIAIDEIEKYGPEAASLLRKHKVIQLDNQNVLYIKDWRK